jgi:hypothetical protein
VKNWFQSLPFKRNLQRYNKAPVTRWALKTSRRIGRAPAQHCCIKWTLSLEAQRLA